MALYGTGNPRFYIGTTLVADLGNSIIERSEPQTDYVVHTSKLNNKRDFIPRGTHLEIDIRVNLFKWSPEARDAMFQYLASFRGTKVSLKPYSSSPKVYKQVNNEDALFLIKEVYPYYLETAEYRDVVRIELVSCDPVDLALSAVATATRASVLIATYYNLDFNSSEIFSSDFQDMGGARVLVKSQTNAAENGIYVIDGSTYGDWTRASDCNSWAELIGASVWVEGGLYAGTGWICDATEGGTLGTTDIHWTQLT